MSMTKKTCQPTTGINNKHLSIDSTTKNISLERRKMFLPVDGRSTLNNSCQLPKDICKRAPIDKIQLKQIN